MGRWWWCRRRRRRRISRKCRSSSRDVLRATRTGEQAARLHRAPSISGLLPLLLLLLLAEGPARPALHAAPSTNPPTRAQNHPTKPAVVERLQEEEALCTNPLTNFRTGSADEKKPNQCDKCDRVIACADNLRKHI